MTGANGRDDALDAWIARLDAWDPDRDDLPDELALAMDAHPELRARFDARFTAWTADDGHASGDASVDDARAADRLLARAQPAPTPRRWGSGWGQAGLAASALAAIALVTASSLVLRAAPPRPAVISGPASTSEATSAIGAPSGDGRDVLGAELAPDVPRAGGEAGDRVALQRGYFDGQDNRDGDGYAYRAPGHEVAPDEGERTGGQTRMSVAFAVDPNAAVDRTLAVDTWYADPLPMGGWTVARTEPRSTFAIDVDRGSYTLARGRLRSGALPDPTTVRVEEFVNALRYDDPSPDDGPLAVQLAATDSPFGDGRILVRVGLKATTPPVRAPVHLTFLVDTSGSMSPADRLPLVKRALGLLVDALGPEDTVAIVTYAGSAGVALPATAASNRPAMHAAIASLTASGGTAMGAGLDLAYALASDAHRVGHTSRVVAASDGDANVGVTDTATLSARIRGYADQGITLTTLGFGNGGYQDARMEQLADDGDGNYFYVDGLDEARRVFVDELASTVQLVARDVKLQVEWNPDAVARYRLIGYENRALRNDQFRDDAVDAGEVGAGHSVTALYVAELVPGRAGPIATVRVRSKPADAPLGEAVEAAVSLPRESVAPAFDQAAPDLRMAVVAATFAERLRGSPYVAGIDLARVEAMGRAAARRGHPEDAELVDLVHRAAALEAHRP